MFRARILTRNERVIRRKTLSDNVSIYNSTGICKLNDSQHKSKDLKKPLQQEMIKFAFKVSKATKLRGIRKFYPSGIVSTNFDCNPKRLNYSVKELKRLIVKWPLNYLLIKFHTNGQIFHKTMHLDWHRMDEMNSSLFLCHLKRLYCLRILKIGGISLTDDTAKKLRKFIKNQWRIKKLSLFVNVRNFTSRGSRSLVKSFEDLSNLQSLSVAAIRQNSNDEYLTLLKTVLSEDVAFLYKRGCHIRFGSDCWRREAFRNREQAILFKLDTSFMGERQLRLVFYPRNHLADYLKYLTLNVHLVARVKNVNFSFFRYIPHLDSEFFGENFRMMGRLIASFSDMQHIALNFSNNYGGDQAFKILFEELKNLKNPQSLRSIHLQLQQNKLSSNILPSIGSFLTNMSQLKRLSIALSFNELGEENDQNFILFSSSMESLYNLKSLEIECSKADLTDRNISHMVKFVQKAKNLEVLEFFLSENRISDKGLKELTHMISEVQTLDSLHLYVQNQKIQLNDDSLSMIIENLNEVSKITLDLSQSTITENGLNVLLGKLKRMEILKYFNGKFLDTSVSKEGLIELSKTYKKVAKNKKLTFDITSKTIPKRTRDSFEMWTLEELGEELQCRKLKKVKR